MNMRFISDLEDLQNRISYGVKAVDAVHDCMSMNHSPAEEYLDALGATIEHLQSLVREFGDLVDVGAGRHAPADPKPIGTIALTGGTFTADELKAMRKMVEACLDQYTTSGGDIDYADCGDRSGGIMLDLLKKLEG